MSVSKSAGEHPCLEEYPWRNILGGQRRERAHFCHRFRETYHFLASAIFNPAPTTGCFLFFGDPRMIRSPARIAKTLQQMPGRSLQGLRPSTFLPQDETALFESRSAKVGDDSFSQVNKNDPRPFSARQRVFRKRRDSGERNSKEPTFFTVERDSALREQLSRQRSRECLQNKRSGSGASVKNTS